MQNLIRELSREGIELPQELRSRWKRALKTEGLTLINKVMDEARTFAAKHRLENAYKVKLERERTAAQRARSGELTTDPPEEPGKSRLVLCEFCTLQVAVIKDPESITQPLNASHFASVHPRSEKPAFIPRATWEHLYCGNCGKRISAEPDKLLVSDGYFLVPEEGAITKEPEAAEASKEKEGEQL